MWKVYLTETNANEGEFSKTQVLVDKTVSVIFCRKKSDKMLVEGKSVLAEAQRVAVEYSKQMHH
jgi:hypothetical protein